MQPSPMAETSRLPAPKLRFCIVITPLLQNPACCKIRRNRTGMAFCSFRTPRYPFQRYGMPVWLRFPNTADSLPNPVGCPDFVHGLAGRVVPYERGKVQVTKPAQKTAESSAMEVGTELVGRIAAHAPSVGEHSTAIAGLILFRRTQATACYRAAVEPSLTVFVQGKKRINLGGITSAVLRHSSYPR